MTARATRRGIIFILSAPSGAGKTTLINGLRAQYPEIEQRVPQSLFPDRPFRLDLVNVTEEWVQGLSISAKDGAEPAPVALVVGRKRHQGRRGVERMAVLALEILAVEEGTSDRLRALGNVLEAHILLPSEVDLEQEQVLGDAITGWTELDDINMNLAWREWRNWNDKGRPMRVTERQLRELYAEDRSLSKRHSEARKSLANVESQRKDIKEQIKYIEAERQRVIDEVNARSVWQEEKDQ